MGNAISFKEVSVSGSGILECRVVRNEGEDRFWIELPYSFEPKPDLIAFAFAALCGTHFDEIAIELPLGELTRAAVAEATRATVNCLPGKDVRRRPGRRGALNFSGGFDSLAAKELLPNYELVSLDFGGRFSRERDFYEAFDPYIFPTNLVDIKLNRPSWQFMGIAAILLRDELDIGTYSFGSIMAGTLPRLLEGAKSQRDTGLAIDTAVQMRVLNPVVGLSEIASMQVAMRANLELVASVMKSVALPREDKYLRKVHMLRSVSRASGIPAPKIEVPERPPRREWGDSFATDLSSLYAMQQLGVDEVKDGYKNGVPDRVLEEVVDLDLDFMLRFNPHAYGEVEGKVRGGWFQILAENSIFPFEEKDWGAARRAVSLLQMRTEGRAEGLQN